MERTRLVRGVLAVVLLLGVVAATTTTGVPAASAQTSAEQSDEFDLWCWVNSERLGRGLAPLPMARLLRDNVARPYSATLAARNSTVLQHRSNLWAATTGAVAGTDYAGENIGYSHVVYSIRSLYDAWMRSSSHRANILSSRWEYIGIGVTHANSRRWSAQNFASTSRTDVTPIYPAGQQFIDVCDSNVFFDDINWMAREGITTGTVYPRYRLFRATTSVSRSAMAAFVYRAVTPGTSTAPPSCAISPHPYTDSSRDQFAAEICWMAENDINDPGGAFSGAQATSRARMAEWLFRAADRDCDEGEVAPADCYQPPANPTFSDVATTHPQYAAVEWASAAGITNGYSDGTFQPSGSITRQAMAAMLHRFVE